MSDERQPEAVWVFPEKKTNKGRVWLIVGLSILALAIVAALLFFLLPRAEDPRPSPSPTLTSTSTPSPSPSASAEPEPEPSMTPVTTPPPAPDPDVSTFTDQVRPRLDDAVRGLDLVSDNLDVGAQIVDSLQQDAGVLSGTAAPRSLADDWSAAAADYAGTLSELREAFDNGSDPQDSLDASRTSLGKLRALVGL